jgi:hypothetical protein
LRKRFGLRKITLGEKEEHKEHSTFKSKREIPSVVKAANESLTDATNHMSLLLCEDNRFLFWGDIESSEIKQTMTELRLKRRN